MIGIILNFTVFIFGLIIGSFLNVVIIRLHDGVSIAKGRSKCPQCGHVLGAWSLIPIFSFIFLRGKCRYCQAKISWQYPLVELATGVLFALAYYFDSASILALFRDMIIISALVVIFVYDLRWLIIPDIVVLPAIAIAFILNLFVGVSAVNMLIGLAIGFGFFGLQYVVSKGAWIGGGDLRLGALMGVLLGWQAVLVALFLSYIIGAIVAISLLIKKKVSAKSQLPFGVFLAPATIIAMFWGAKIATWYLSRMTY